MTAQVWQTWLHSSHASFIHIFCYILSVLDYSKLSDEGFNDAELNWMNYSLFPWYGWNAGNLRDSHIVRNAILDNDRVTKSRWLSGGEHCARGNWDSEVVCVWCHCVRGTQGAGGSGRREAVLGRYRGKNADVVKDQTVLLEEEEAKEEQLPQAV